MLKYKKLTGVENGGGMILRERPRVDIELLGKLNTKRTNRLYVLRQIHVLLSKGISVYCQVKTFLSTLDTIATCLKT